MSDPAAVPVSAPFGDDDELRFLGAVEDALRPPAPRRAAVLACELDGLQRVHDTLGAAVAAEVRRAAGTRMAARLARRDVLVATGTSGHAVLLPGVGDVEAVRTAVCALLDCVAAPFEAGGIRVRLTMRIGCALAPEHADEAQTLVQQAGIALRAPAPAGSGAWQLYRPDMWRRSLRNLVLLSDLPRAIVSGELVLHYQPLLDLATRTTVGAEALVRWRHPRDGLLPPADFIALAEESGEIEALGRWVADEALRQHAAWRAAGLAPGGIAVNVSPGEVLAGGLPDALAALARRHGVPPGEVTVELTEGTFLDDPDRAIAELGRLRQAGFGIAIDDFGTGYSAFALLVRLPVTGLKIDRSFVLGLGEDARRERVVQTTIELAHNLDMTVVAEGVETEEQARLLALRDCGRAQGYLFARPMPPDAYARWLAGSRAGR